MSGPAEALHWLAAGLYGLAVAWAVVCDARWLLIPNWTAATAALAFPPAAVIAGLAPAAIAWHLGVGIGLLAGGAVLFGRGILGGGDVKLLAAVGVWIGPDDLLAYLVAVSLLGGVLALAVMAAGRLKRRWPALAAVPWLGEGRPGTQAIPYGIAIGLAGLLLLARNPALPAAWAAALP